MNGYGILQLHLSHCAVANSIYSRIHLRLAGPNHGHVSPFMHSHAQASDFLRSYRKQGELQID